MDIQSQEINDHCPLFGNCSWDFKFHSSYHNYNLPIYECKTCKLQKIYPVNINHESVYGEDYYSGKSEYSYKDERRTKKFDSYVWDARIKNIQKFIKSGNFLDVGSSFGGLLSRANHFGFKVQGVEVSSYSSRFANERGIPTINSNFLEANLSENYYDVITLIEVIEHLEKPDLVFSKLGKILKPGGLLLIQTANFEGNQAIQEGANYHYYLPGHLYYYSLSNLKNILTKNGFQRFTVYTGVDFGLLPKLLKSRGSFKSWKDYFKWFRIANYHWKSKFFPGSTSSLVLYAFK